MSFRDADFHSLTRSIVFQQLNGKAAGAIFDRLAVAAGANPLTPESILQVPLPDLRAVGLSGQKASYVRDLAERTRAGQVDFAQLPSLDDDSVIAHLTQVKGVGVWTAHMFLMFSLRRPDILPTGDYGIQAAIKKYYKKRKWPKPAVMEKIAKPWVPYRSVACWYLWRGLDIKTV